MLDGLQASFAFCFFSLVSLCLLSHSYRYGHLVLPCTSVDTTAQHMRAYTTYYRSVLWQLFSVT